VSPGRSARLVAGLALLTGACATPGQVRRVETLVQVVRTENARQDSARAAELGRIMALQQRLLDSIAASRQALRAVESKLSGDLTEVQRQLLQIQELTGQSQKRLSDLKAQLDARAEQQEAVPPATPNPAAPDSGTPAGPPTVSADNMFQTALRQLNRGSLVTARQGFLDFLQSYPNHSQVPDAIYFIGETYAVAAPDSAVARYTEVVTRFPQSSRAPTSLYKIGLLAERRNDLTTARATFQRVIQQYPRSEEAELARGRLAALKP
jgi:tol-pal system protein YbgF